MRVAIIAKARNGALVAYRQGLGLSQAKAAELCGVSHGQWNALECMRFDQIGDVVIEQIADSIDVHPYVIAPPEARGVRLKWEETAFVDVQPRQLGAALSRSLTSEVEVDAIELAESKNTINREMDKCLSFREREVLKLRYGLGEDGYTYTLEEVGKIFRVTRERVREVQTKALRKLGARQDIVDCYPISAHFA